MIEETSKIFVGNVPFQCSKEEFNECFIDCDGFVDGDIINKYNSGNSRGFGFVRFDSVENMDKFMESKRQIILKNRMLRFTKYMATEKKIINGKYNDRNFIFVKNIPDEYKIEDVRNIFDKYSQIGICFINTNTNTGESKGTAVVEILDDDSYEKLLDDKFIIQDNIILQLSKWKQKIKVKKSTDKIHNVKELYKFI